MAEKHRKYENVLNLEFEICKLSYLFENFPEFGVKILRGSVKSSIKAPTPDPLPKAVLRVLVLVLVIFIFLWSQLILIR